MIGPKDEGERDPAAEPWWLMALKVGIAMALADFAARLAGFSSPSVATISTVFIAAQPPAKSIGKGLRRWFAALGGVVVGTLAAFAIAFAGAPPTAAFLFVGLVAGALRPRSIDYLYAAVIGAVVALKVQSGGDPVLEIAVAEAIQVTIGCAVAPLVVLVLDRVWHRQDEANH